MAHTSALESHHHHHHDASTTMMIVMMPMFSTLTTVRPSVINFLAQPNVSTIPKMLVRSTVFALFVGSSMAFAPSNLPRQSASSLFMASEASSEDRRSFVTKVRMTDDKTFYSGQNNIFWYCSCFLFVFFRLDQLQLLLV